MDAPCPKNGLLRCDDVPGLEWALDMMTRREFVATASGAALGSALAPRSAGAASLASTLAAIERSSGGRLGVAVIDTRSGTRHGHRADEHFPLCSTFKLLAVSAVLSRVDAGKDRLDRRIRFEARDLVTYSPVTKDHTGAPGVTLEDLCEAAITVSDNTAANLLLTVLGGPAGLTAYARSLGDSVTRLDRMEPELNEAAPGDPRDTTSPAAMASTLNTLVLGDALSSSSRARLTHWLLASKTGDARLRAGVPAGWRVGDKTGSGARGTANDVGVLWPPRGAPILVAVYLTEAKVDGAGRNAAIAAVARAVTSHVAP